MKTWIYSWRSRRTRGFELLLSSGTRMLYAGQFASDGYWEIQFCNCVGYGSTIHAAFVDLRSNLSIKSANPSTDD